MAPQCGPRVRRLVLASYVTGVDGVASACAHLQPPHCVRCASEPEATVRDCLKGCHAPDHIYHDARARSHPGSPWGGHGFDGLPCQSYSNAGERQGASDGHGRVAWIVDVVDVVSGLVEA